MRIRDGNRDRHLHQHWHLYQNKNKKKKNIYYNFKVDYILMINVAIMNVVNMQGSWHVLSDQHDQEGHQNAGRCLHVDNA